jgi:hypothetical protein
MSKNTYKVSSKSSGRKSIFGRIEEALKIPVLFDRGVPVKYVPYVLFLTAIGIFYIGNTHYADKTVRKIDRLKVEVEDLRADFTTLKSDYMFASKQSEVAKSVRKSGIVESVQPPQKIVVEKGEY